MNENDLNIEYICKKTLLNKDDELVPIILDLIQDSYKVGLCQAEFDNTMNLIEENEELKKQLKEWENHLKCSKEMLDIQGQKGNYDYDEYMLGLYNGMEYIIALFETREPNYISGKDVKFTSNKTQQKEFIKWLEDEIKKQKEDIFENSLTAKDIDLYIKRIKLLKIEEILQKYKEIIGEYK